MVLYPTQYSTQAKGFDPAPKKHADRWGISNLPVPGPGQRSADDSYHKESHHSRDHDSPEFRMG
jgi:hypothetical protein